MKMIQTWASSKYKEKSEVPTHISELIDSIEVTVVSSSKITCTPDQNISKHKHCTHAHICAHTNPAHAQTRKRAYIHDIPPPHTYAHWHTRAHTLTRTCARDDTYTSLHRTWIHSILVYRFLKRDQRTLL